MSEIHFAVENSPEGGFTACAVNEDIFTTGDDMADLYANARDAVRCHLDEEATVTITLHGRH